MTITEEVLKIRVDWNDEFQVVIHQRKPIATYTLEQVDELVEELLRTRAHVAGMVEDDKVQALQDLVNAQLVSDIDYGMEDSIIVNGSVRALTAPELSPGERVRVEAFGLLTGDEGAV